MLKIKRLSLIKKKWKKLVKILLYFIYCCVKNENITLKKNRRQFCWDKRILVYKQIVIEIL